MRFVPAKNLTRWLAHFFIALALLLGSRTLADDPSAEEPPAEEPADEEDESIVSYILDFFEPEDKPITAQ